jgi:F-type H+-transporting ATPase subunit delta
MAKGSLARRYAQALINLGKEEDGLTERMGQDLETFQDSLQEGNNLLFNALLNPGFLLSERSAVLKKVLEKLVLHNYTANFLQLLLDNGRMAHFDAIQETYQQMADKLIGRVRAEVITAREIDVTERLNIRKSLAKAANASATSLVVTYKVDPQLIGGIIARVDDVVYDASIRSRLQDIKASLV